jgi:hypothetical protein
MKSRHSLKRSTPTKGVDFLSDSETYIDHIATCGWPYVTMCPRCFPPFALSESL